MASTAHTVTNPGPKRRRLHTAVGERWIDAGVTVTFPMTAAQVKQAETAGFEGATPKTEKPSKTEKPTEQNPEGPSDVQE